MDGSNKRPLVDDGGSGGDDDDNDRDRKKFKKVIGVEEPETGVGLTNLCDDVVMHIFKYLPHDSLANMSLVHPSLARVSDDWTLWKRVRFETFHKTMEDTYVRYLKDLTTHIDINGGNVPSYENTVSHRFIILLEMKCPNLTHLGLRRQKFDAGEISVKILHRKLKSLNIEHTVIENIPDSTSYLCGLNITCPDLEDIRMTFNDWFVPPCLYALAKLEKLTYLSLQGCNQFKDCIPYASITAITGFKCLRTLDLRLTPISDHELVCFQRLKNLKHVFLECPAYVNHDGDATITDLGVSGFCPSNFEYQYPFIQILIDRDGEVNLRRINDRNNHVDKCKLETLYVRSYPRVTNVFLKNAAKSCPFIKCLDVTGTSCTTDEIERFKTKRPNVSIVC